VKILAIVVRYQMPLSESPTLRGLCEAFSSEPDLAQSYAVMIWDNSQHAITNPQLPIPFLYHHSQVNLGVSSAYNFAMEYALKHGYEWMLLLDQDTRITSEFLLAMLRHSLNLLPRQEIAAIAPTVLVRGYAVSPKRLLLLDRHRMYAHPKQCVLYIAKRLRILNKNCMYPIGECGIAPGEAVAINNGCIMRVASLRTIGGFSTDFWLDYSDIYLFRQLFEHGMKVWRAADVELEHDMTIMDYEHPMTPWRYRIRACAETAFNDLYSGRLENAIQTLKFFARAIKQRMKYGNPEFSRIAWEQFMYRLRAPREERIARWLNESIKRASQQADRTDEMGRPAVE
jgi:GT2 family glycosyltransferase